MSQSLKLSESPPPGTTLFDLPTSTGLTMSARAEKRNTAKSSDRSRGRVLLIADDDQTQFVDAVTARGIERGRRVERPGGDGLIAAVASASRGRESFGARVENQRARKDAGGVG